MAQDTALVERVRGHLGHRTDLSEASMFGGVAFLVGGNIAVTVSRRGLMVRVGKDGEGAALSRPGVSPVVMSTRRMHGWIRVAPDALETDPVLHDWVDEGVAFAATLPPKGT